MPKYVILIDTDADLDAEQGIQQVTAAHNAEVLSRNAALPEGAEPELELTNEQYLARVLEIAVSSYSDVFLKSKTESLSKKFEKADPATRQAVEDALALVAAFQPQPQPKSKTK